MKRNYRPDGKCIPLSIHDIHTLYVIYTYIYAFECVYIKQPEGWRPERELHEQIEAELISPNRL